MKPAPILAGAALLIAAAVAVRSQTPPPPIAKVAVVDMQAAILGTQEGRKAVADLQTRFEPLKTQLEKKETELQVLQAQLQRGAATMTDEARAKMERQIESLSRSAKHDSEDLNAEGSAEQSAVTHALEVKMLAEIEKYAGQNGYTLVLDVSNPQQNQVLYAPVGFNITADLIRHYDQTHK
jgi:outer membrane protein